MINSHVLVLNRVYLPIHITSVRRAFSLLYQGYAKALDNNMQVFNFQSWSELSVEHHHDAIGTVDRLIRVPRVIVLQVYDRLPRRTVRFSRLNIFGRDHNACQYCGRTLPKHLLNLDHVVPRSRGGESSWENVVCCCHRCNRKKGGKSPREAGMKLLKRPVKPQWTSFVLTSQVGDAHMG